MFAPARRRGRHRFPRTRPRSPTRRPTRWRSTSADLDTSSRGPEPTREGRLRSAIEGVLPRDRFGDHRDILGGASQNVLGLVVGAVAALGAQLLITNTLGAPRYGVVTLAVQLAFVGSTATRFGMDVANVRLVAILVGRGQSGRVRGLVVRSAAIAATVSVAAGLAILAGSGWLARTFSDLPSVALPAFQAAALALPLAAMAQTYLGATRGLKIMRHTLYVFWVGQPIGWIVLTLAG